MQTLRWRLTLWYGGMAAAILIILATILYLSARSSLVAVRQDDVRDTADSVRQVLEETGTPASAVGNVRRKDIRTVWAIGEVRREDVQVIIRDAEGAVLAETPHGDRDAPEIEATDVVYPEVRRDGRYLTTTPRRSGRACGRGRPSPRYRARAWCRRPPARPDRRP